MMFTPKPEIYMNIQSKQGQNIPYTEFRIIENGEWKTVNTNDIFNNRTVVVFALPGAFTPTCSSTHLPRYNQLAETFYKNGVDEIICISVNDTFVMNAWKQEQDASHISFIPDGNGEFSEGMGMLVEKDEIGFGKRSWRYSMLVKNGVVEKQFIEPDQPGDPFEVSDADTLLEAINPQAIKPSFVSLFTRDGCPFCDKAKDALRKNGIQFEVINASSAISSRSLQAVTGRGTYPQAYIDGQHIGGSEELLAYLSSNSINNAA